MGIQIPRLGPRLRSSDHYHAGGYTHLEELYRERDAVAWYWRMIALASSWMVLGGYLILPSLFYTEDQPGSRFSTPVLAIVVVALLTAGYSLTALLWFAVRNLLFQAEAIFLPALASSVLGLLALLYAFVSSAAYVLTAPAIVHIVLSTSATTIYAFLLWTVHRKINRIRRSVSSIPSHSPPSLNGDPFRDPHPDEPVITPGTATFQQNYIANHFPQARPWIHAQSRDQLSYTSHENIAPIRSYSRVNTEEEMINSQMRTLLSRQADPSPRADSSTYRLEWNEEEDPEPIDPSGLPHHQRSRSDTLQVGGVREFYGANRSNSGYSSSGISSNSYGREGSIWSRLSGRANVERGRSDTRPDLAGPGQQRTKSREERRREIEMGTMNTG